jgi:hypothetical protein
VTRNVEAPGGRRWTVRLSLLRGRDGRGRRWRWRGPDPGWLEALRLGELAGLAEIPVIGVVILVLVAIPVVAVLLAFLPFVVLGLVEVLLLAGLFVVGIAAATLLGRPILVRAEDAADPEGGLYLWAVKGWSASRRVRDAVVEALRTGAEPEAVVDQAAILVARHAPR